MPSNSKKHLLIYLGLSFAISWAVWIPLALTRIEYKSSPYLLAAALMGAFWPDLAAIILNYLVKDLDQIIDFRQRIYNLKRIRPAWHLIILTLWPVLHGIAIGISTLLGQPIKSKWVLGSIP